MKAIAIKNSDGNIVSTVTTTEFVGVLAELDHMVRMTGASNPHIDYARLYEIDLWNIIENEGVNRLWEVALSRYLSRIYAADFSRAANDLLKSLKPNMPAIPTPVPIDESEFEDEEIPDSCINGDILAKTVVNTNAACIVDLFASQSLEIVTRFEPEFFRCVSDYNYWVNVQRFINANWEEIFNFVEHQREETVDISKDFLPSYAIEAVERVYKDAGLLI